MKLTKAEISQRRRKRLKELALKLGYTSWTSVETALLKNKIKIVVDKTMVV